MTITAATDEYERGLWEELLSLVSDVVPDGATDDEKDRAIMVALLGHVPEVHQLHETARRLARDQPAGYIRAKMDEDNPISRARIRLYGRRWA